MAAISARRRSVTSQTSRAPSRVRAMSTSRRSALFSSRVTRWAAMRRSTMRMAVEEVTASRSASWLSRVSPWPSRTTRVRNWVIVTASSTWANDRAETPTSAREAVRRAETSSSAPSEVMASLPGAGAVITVLSSCRVLAGQGPVLWAVYRRLTARLGGLPGFSDFVSDSNCCILQVMSHTLSPPGPAPVLRRAPRVATLALQHGRARLATQLRSSNSGLMLLAVLVGLGAGGGAIVFRWLIRTFTLLLSGHADYSLAGHAAHPGLPGLGRWFVIGAPVVAGLLYGPLVHFFAREARGHGVPEVMFAVARKGGRIAPQVAAVKALASALCIGGGGSVGREGPIVQIGSALGSTLGRVVRISEPRMRLLVACGAAGGIAATFNAPLAGVFFAMELILANFEVHSFGMIVLSSVTASVVGRAAMGSAPFLKLPNFTVGHLWEYGLFAVLGLLGGVAGVFFTRVLYAIEVVCDRVWHGPEWLRPAAGGVLLGLLLLVLPQMYGVGYPVLAAGIAGKY